MLNAPTVLDPDSVALLLFNLAVYRQKRRRSSRLGTEPPC